MDEWTSKNDCNTDLFPLKSCPSPQHWCMERDLLHNLRSGKIDSLIGLQGASEVHVIQESRLVHENQRLMAELRESERRFREILEHVQMLSLIMDTQYSLVYCNAFFKDLCGYDVDDLIGMSFFDVLVPEAHHALVSQDLIRCFDHDGQPVHFECEMRDRTGQLYWISWNFTPMRDTTGQVIGVSGLGEDVTVRKVSEMAMQNFNLELERLVEERTAELILLNKELEAFSYSVSHDLRAPLRAIDGFSYALLEDCGEHLGNQGQDHLRRVRSATQRMSVLIDALLDLSRLNRYELNVQAVDLSMISNKILCELRRIHPHRQIECVVPETVPCQGDPRLLEIVLDNLLGNAWKFTAKRDQARIEFGVMQHEGQRVYYVKDNGAGFDMVYKDKLFGVFQRLHGAADFDGTGIGLATVQRIIHRHRGMIWAEGEMDRGANFYFTLNEPA